jgi:hypothetical protein
MVNPVIVTALFDIERDKWDNYEQSYHTYIEWMKNLLSLNSKIVIYTEEKFLSQIIEIRKKYDKNLENTLLVLKKFEELDFYKTYYEPIKKLMESDEFKSKIHWQVPEMTKPKYNIVIYNKISFIEESFNNSYLGGDFYVWLDAGISRDKKYNEIVFPKPEKIINEYSNKITFFTLKERLELPKPEEHLLHQYRNIQGGCFFVPSLESILRFKLEFEKKLYYYYQEGYVGSEEKYYDLCYLDNPSNYNLIQSDWRDYFKLF